MLLGLCLDTPTNNQCRYLSLECFPPTIFSTDEARDKREPGAILLKIVDEILRQPNSRILAYSTIIE